MSNTTANPHTAGTAYHKAWSEGFQGKPLTTHALCAYGRAHAQGSLAAYALKSNSSQQLT